MSLTQGALLTICQGGTVLNPVLQVKIYIEFFVDRNVEIEPSCTFVLTTFNATYSGPGSVMSKSFYYFIFEGTITRVGSSGRFLFNEQMGKNAQVRKQTLFEFKFLLIFP